MAIYQGADEPITFTITGAGGSELLPTLANYVIVLYYEQGEAVLQRYSKGVLTGYEPIEELTATTCKVLLQKETTKAAKEGMVHAEIKTFLTDLDFTNGKFDSVIRGKEIGEIKKALTSNLL